MNKPAQAVVQRCTKKQNGFSLLEVMIALIVSNIALLGLVAGELKSLQYANNSFQYTSSLIHANNVVERVLNDVCKLKSNLQAFDDDYVKTLKPQDNDYKLNFEQITPGANAFKENFTVLVRWDDKRVGTNSENQVAVRAVFPSVEPGCNVI